MKREKCCGITSVTGGGGEAVAEERGGELEEKRE